MINLTEVTEVTEISRSPLCLNVIIDDRYLLQFSEDASRISPGTHGNDYAGWSTPSGAEMCWKNEDHQDQFHEYMNEDHDNYYKTKDLVDQFSLGELTESSHD